MNEMLDELMNLYEGYFETLPSSYKQELQDKLEDLLEEFQDYIEEDRLNNALKEE